MKIFSLLLAVMIFSANLSFANKDHDIHISMCELRYNEQSSSFEVAIKIFIDDLETALKKQNITGLHIGLPNESDVADEYISSYIHDQFSINVNGTKLVPEFVGKEVTDDNIAVWCYLEYKTQIPRAAKCTLTNKVLFEVYNDQRNIMDIRMGSSHKDYTILDASHSSWTYNF